MAGLFDLGTIDKLQSIRNKQRRENETNTSHSESGLSLFSFIICYWKYKVIMRAGFRLF